MLEYFDCCMLVGGKRGVLAVLNIDSERRTKIGLGVVSLSAQKVN